VVASLASVASPAGAAEVETSFSTEEPVERGGTTASDGPGSVLATWEAGACLELDADRLHVRTVWERGRTADAGIPYRHLEADGTSHGNFTDATFTFQQAEPDAKVFTEPWANATTTGRGLGGSSLSAIGEDVMLVRGGCSDEGASVGEGRTPSYVYRTPEPAALETLEVGGSFTLFVHNLTMAITHGDGETWRNGTGFRQGGGAAAEDELRVTTIEVQAGDLTVRHPGGASLVAGNLSTEIDGAP
jgi:hypothetical protein